MQNLQAVRIKDSLHCIEFNFVYSVQHQEMFVLKGSLFVVSCMKFWIHRRYPYCNTLKRIILKLFLISNFRRVLNAVCFLLGNSPVPEFYMRTFRNILSVPSP